MNETMEALKWLDAEYGGFSDLPDSVYFVTLNVQNSKVHTFESGTKYRLGWQVTHGDYARREIGDFLQWRRTNKDGTANDEFTTFARRQVASIIKAAQAASGSDTLGAEAITMLRHSTSVETDMAGLRQLAQELAGIRIPIRLVSTSKKEKNDAGEEVVIATYQNVRYLDKGKPIEATDPAELAAVRV